MLNKEATYEDYQTNSQLPLLIMYEMSLELKDKAFDNLISFIGDYELHNDSLVNELVYLYDNFKERLLIVEGETSRNDFEMLKKLKNEKEWYHEFHLSKNTNKYPDRVIEYFLNDPFYLNEVSYREAIGFQLHCKMIMSFRQLAIDVHKELSLQIGATMNKSIIVKDINEFEHLIGDYQSNDGLYNLEIKIENDELVYFHQRKTDLSNGTRRILNPAIDTKNTFVINNAFGAFRYDEKAEINGLILSLGSKRRKYTKLRKTKG